MAEIDTKFANSQVGGMKKAPSNASLDRVITTAKMVALQSKGSNSSLNNLRSSLATGDNPRRGSASGVYGLPVPPDNLKLGGTSNLTGDTGLHRYSKLST